MIIGFSDMSSDEQMKNLILGFYTIAHKFFL